MVRLTHGNNLAPVCVLGVCGGIASGKTKRCAHLAQAFDGALFGEHHTSLPKITGRALDLSLPIILHVKHINVDVVAHSLYASPTQPVFTELVKTFGESIVSSEGHINRQHLGTKVFGHPAELAKLNQIMWPPLRREIESILNAITTKVIESNTKDSGHRHVGYPLLEMAILDECDSLLPLLSHLWICHVPPAIALERIKLRNPALSPEECTRRIASQRTFRERIEAFKMWSDSRPPHLKVVPFEGIETAEDTLERGLKAIEETFMAYVARSWPWQDDGVKMS